MEDDDDGAQLRQDEGRREQVSESTMRAIIDQLESRGMMSLYLHLRLDMFKTTRACTVGAGSRRRNPWSLWLMRAKHPCRRFALGAGGIEDELELIFRTAATIERCQRIASSSESDHIVRTTELTEQMEEERDAVLELAQRLRALLTACGITLTTSPVSGHSSIELLYTLTVYGIFLNVIPLALIPADCAYGLMRLATQLLRMHTRLQASERIMGLLRGQVVLQQSRLSGTDLFALFVFEQAAAFPRWRFSFRLYLCLDHIDAEPRWYEVGYAKTAFKLGGD